MYESPRAKHVASRGGFLKERAHGMRGSAAAGAASQTYDAIGRVRARLDEIGRIDALRKVRAGGNFAIGIHSHIVK
ncbi:hypothetical protein B5F10_09670 [Anaerotruncus colihominis]|uniref:Uncharacterized protein n=1 Tax=Anaerotruncus colihominis TaxID=169435 RepID=A0A1Y4MZ47_9FIRM|nr:hypothetical protein B5F11_10880 [Anaerotruncus colihominis]OUP73958.1 hypothetical protein B5F10_09670 [Anaerotruncus colihominis]RGE67040.1 hypothetical protein DXC40_12465 [Anaerotruncus colihominis]